MSHSPIFTDWLIAQHNAAVELSEDSDIVTVMPVSETHFVAEFRCNGLVKDDASEPQTADRFLVEVAFSEKYMRIFNPQEILCVRYPQNVFHPNVRWIAICPGNITPGTGIIDLLQQVYMILSYQTFSPGDALNGEAAAWARDNMQRFPTDRRTLRRKKLSLQYQEGVSV